jgi:hypothetical protein
MMAISGARHRSRAFVVPNTKMKTTGVTAGGQLSKDATSETELSLDYQMHEVVRHERVKTRSRVHLDIRKSGTLRFHCIPSLTGAMKHDNHVMPAIIDCYFIHRLHRLLNQSV